MGKLRLGEVWWAVQSCPVTYLGRQSANPGLLLPSLCVSPMLVPFAFPGNKEMVWLLQARPFSGKYITRSLLVHSGSDYFHPLGCEPGVCGVLLRAHPTVPPSVCAVTLRGAGCRPFPLCTGGVT